MKSRKTRISLFEFLETGRFGPFTPRRDCSPEEVIAEFGKPDRIEVCATGRAGEHYRAGDPGCFPVIVSYGVVEFHFDSPSTMYALFSDTFFSGLPVGGPLKLTDAALLRYGRTMEDFMALAKARGLAIPSSQPHCPPHAWKVMTGGGIELHFEHDDPEAAGSRPTLRAFSWSHPFVA